MEMKDSTSVDYHHHIPSPITPKQTDDPYPVPTHQAHQVTPKKERVVMNLIAYKECLKNHAASLGSHATDGCGEFIPGGPAPPLDPLRCSACGCHRNFHRKEVLNSDALDSHTSTACLPQCHYLSSTTTSTTPSLRPSGVLRTRRAAHDVATDAGHTAMVARDGGITMDEENGGEGNGTMSLEVKKKRHRTKFSTEQKEKMVEFAKKAGWKMLKLEEGLVQQFCQEVGIQRKVLKVWMHNNKHHFAKPNFNINDDYHLSPSNDTVSHSNSSDC